MLSEKLKKTEYQGAARLIDKADRIVIFTHISPDGDAVGSTTAMLQYLRKLKKEVSAIVYNRFPDFLAWIPCSDEIHIYENEQEVCDKLIELADMFICLDIGEWKRVGKLEEKVKSRMAETENGTAKPFTSIVIDHHEDPTMKPDILISYPDSPSTCELVFRLICRVGDFKLIDLQMATCICTGMMTDTGNFSYNANDVDSYYILSELVRLGVDKNTIYQKVFQAYSADRMRLMGYCLYHSMKLFPKQHCALIALSKRELMRFNFTSGDAEGLVNIPLCINDICYSVFMREDVDKIKISFRSQGLDHPVNELARQYFNGGGHVNAAGGELYGDFSEAVKKVEQVILERL